MQKLIALILAYFDQVAILKAKNADLAQQLAAANLAYGKLAVSGANGERDSGAKIAAMQAELDAVHSETDDLTAKLQSHIEELSPGSIPEPVPIIAPLPLASQPIPAALTSPEFPNLPPPTAPVLAPDNASSSSSSSSAPEVVSAPAVPPDPADFPNTVAQPSGTPQVDPVVAEVNDPTHPILTPSSSSASSSSL